jgi:amino acid transporter
MSSIPEENVGERAGESATDELATLGYTQELRRSLGFLFSFAVQFSMIAIGSTLMLTLSMGMNRFGPAMIIAWIVGGVLQLILGAVIAQLISIYPLAGGVYQIIGRLSGRRSLAWQAGWLIALAHIVSLPQVSVGLAPFIANWFGVELKGRWDVALWAAGLTLGVTAINLLSVKVASMVNNVAIGAEIIGVTIVVVALIFVPHHRQPVSILLDTAGTTGGGHWIAPFLWALLLPGLMISSFDSSGNTSEETRDAARSVPRGLVLANTSSFLVGTLILVLLFLGIQNLPEVMASSSPMTTILNSAVGSTVTNIFEALAIAALIGAMLVLQLTAARIMFAQARDRQLPASSWFHKLNREKVPANATIVTGVIALLAILWSSQFEVLSALVGVAWALGYAAAAVVGVWALKTGRLPAAAWNLGRFTVPAFWIAAIWGVTLCVLFILQNPKQIGVGMAVVILVGFAIHRMVPAKDRNTDWTAPAPASQD